MTGWRVRGESVGGQGEESEVSVWECREGESEVSLRGECETVSTSMVECTGLCDRVEMRGEFVGGQGVESEVSLWEDRDRVESQR